MTRLITSKLQIFMPARIFMKINQKNGTADRKLLDIRSKYYTFSCTCISAISNKDPLISLWKFHSSVFRLKLLDFHLKYN